MYSVRILVCLLVRVTFVLDSVRGQEFETTNGRIKGEIITIRGKPLDVFHGIPFAKPPVGELRFKHPQPDEPWRPEVKDASREKPSCMQSTLSYDIFKFTEILRPPMDFSEDCLYLNIWKPAASAKVGSELAVMVWIHGGAFTTGTTRMPMYNGQYLAAENDVIVVSVNYRIGPLGFSYLGPDTIPGNMGLMDQLEGLKWVKNNIANFGGDKHKITIFGESAGGFSAGYHLTSPLSQNLFNNAILQSGVPVHSTQNVLMHTPAAARTSVKQLSSLLNCSATSDDDIYECLKSTDAQTLLRSQLGVMFYPVIDGYFLPGKPITLIKEGKHKKTNVLLGVTKDEATLFFYMFLNPIERTLKSTGELFSSEDLQLSITTLTGLTRSNRLNALKYFYGSEPNPPLDYLQILNHLVSDLIFKCPTLLFSSLYAQTNDAYLYSLDHRISTMIHPEWMGVPHAFDLDLVFGHPLNESFSFTPKEQELSKTIMTYWSNFAKSGNPNSPVAVTRTWPVFNKEDLTYMALDVGSNLATQHGFRRHQCAFLNDILPMIPEEADKSKLATSSSDSGDISDQSCHSNKQDDDSCSSRDSP